MNLWIVSKETGEIRGEYPNWIDLRQALKSFKTRKLDLRQYVILDEEGRVITASNIILD